jgi:hypothetical protein
MFVSNIITNKTKKNKKNVRNYFYNTDTQKNTIVFFSEYGSPRLYAYVIDYSRILKLCINIIQVINLDLIKNNSGWKSSGEFIERVDRFHFSVPNG